MYLLFIKKNTVIKKSSDKMKGCEFYKDLTYYPLTHFENAKNIEFINIEKGEYDVGKVSEKFKENLKWFKNLIEV